MPSFTRISDKRNLRENFHVLIIGAGTTGLLLAQGLKKEGVSFSIHERSNSDTYINRQRDWTMALHWGSDYLRACLPDDIAQDLKTVQPDPWIDLTEEEEHTFSMINGLTGDVALARNERTTRRASREKLRSLLARGLNIQYGKKLVDIETNDADGKVTVRFEDGSAAVGDALVGCDSVKSYVRNFLLGLKAQLETMPVIAYNFTCHYTAEQARYVRHTGHPLMKSGVHETQNSLYMISALDIKDKNDPETWKFQHFFNLWAPDVEHLPTPAERMAHFKRLAADYAEPFRSAALWVPDDTYIPADRIRHWTGICEWPNYCGRITIAGDAAHPMSPYRGQGMNNGLHDAHSYIKSLTRFLDGERSLEQAIGEYDAEVLRRGAREIKTSAIQGYSSMHFDKLLTSPVASHGFRKISYDKHPVEDLNDFKTGVKVPDGQSGSVQIKVC